MAAVLAALVLLQFRAWKGFDWATFYNQTSRVHTLSIVSAIALIYLAYLMRAVRWKLFLRPVRREAKVTRLLVPTVIGFTGLAVLGRPGELIRPYLIARNEDLAFSSQLAVWTVERIFDLSGFALLFIAAIFFSAAPQHLPYYARFRQASFLLAALIVVFALAAAVIGVKGASLALWFEGQCSRLSSDLGPKIALRIREFRAGLNIIDGASSLIQLIAVSTLMWFTIALSFQQVANSYGAQVLRLPISNVIVLMGSTVVGFRDSVACGGRRFSARDHCRPATGLSCPARTRRKLRNSDLAGNLRQRDSIRIAAGPQTTAILVEALAADPSVSSR